MATSQQDLLETSRRLEKFLDRKDEPVWLRIEGEGGTEMTLAVPAAALHLLSGILNEMAKGKAVTLHSEDADLKTRERLKALEELSALDQELGFGY